MNQVPTVDIEIRHKIFIVSRKFYGTYGKMKVARRWYLLFLIVKLFRTKYIFKFGTD